MESLRPEIEDGLALFQHMRAREYRNYLNNCNDDIEEIKYEGGLSTFRISGSTPTRKGGGLLISDIEKSDYDWLLTPPGTPLFPSLDQETASINFSQRTTPTCSASASKSLKDPSLKSLSESPSPHQISAPWSTCKTTCTYTSPSPQRKYAVSSARPSASSSRARSPSASPAPSLTRTRPTTGAVSPSRSITPTGRLPATASKSTSRPSTPTLCRNNTSPSSASRRGYLAHKGPRRSLSPSLGPWEPIMAVLSTEPLPNLRTSPSSRSIQRGKSECSEQGITANNKDLATRHDAQYAIELLAQNKNKGHNNTSETSRVSTRCEDSKYGSSPARRRPQSTTTCTKEVLSSFANRKLTERQAPPGRNSQNMFRPLMSSAPSTSIYRTGPDLSNHNISSSSVMPSMFINESRKQNTRVSHGRGCSHDSDGQKKDLLNSRSIVIDPGKLQGSVNNENDLSYESHNCVLLEDATKEPTMSEAKPEEETCLAGAWDTNHPFVCEVSKDDSGCKDIRIAGAHEFTCVKLLNSDTDVSVRDLDPLKKGVSQKHHTHIPLAHSFSGESQMQNVRFSREKLSEHSREDNKMSASNKFQSSLGSKLNKDDAGPAFESFSTQAFKNCARVGSQDGARSTNFHPVRRQLSMKSADMVYGMWHMKKAGSFDISTSDSYSCSESLDSSYVDNHTEKFSEDLSEVDSMSHTGYSLSTASMTNHSFYNHTCAEKPFIEIPTELGMGDDRFMHCTSLNSASGALESSEPAVECCEKEQSIQSRTQSQASTMMDLSQLWTPSADSQNQAATNGNDAISVKDVLSFMDACNTKLMETKQSTAGKLYSKVDVNGEHATKALKLVAEDGDSGEVHALESTSAGVVMEETTGWDDDSKKVLPWASPLKRNITLEEATGTILFCSSIVHEIVYEAATLGEEKCNASIEEPSRVCGRISGPSPLWRTSKSWSHRREPAPADHGLQPMTKHVLTSNKGVLPSAYAAGKAHHERKKKALCGFGFCRVM